VEAAAEMAEHFAPSRFNGCCDIVDTNFPSDQCNHLAIARGCWIWKISDVNWQQIHRWTPCNRTAVTAYHYLQLIVGSTSWWWIPISVSDRN